MRITRLVLKDVGPFGTLDLHLPAGTRPDRADVHLLVGPNGTGKSTVLSAIAQCFAWRDEPGFVGKLRSYEAWAAVDTDFGWLASKDKALDGLTGVSRGAPILKGPAYDGLRAYLSTAGVTGEPPSWGIRAGDYLSYQMSLAAESDSPALLRPLSWAVFAYGGLRSVAEGPVSGARSQSENPLRDAIHSGLPEGTRQFQQWAINAITRSALSAQRGGAPSQSAAMLDRLRDALREVTGADVRFELLEGPLTLAVALAGGPLAPVDMLPDGLKSLLAWLGDLLMRLDRIPWIAPKPPNEQPFVLLLDEVEVHLHPAWQRRVLPMVERLFPNAQIIASTHSPFVVTSASDAWIHGFRLQDGMAVVDPPLESAQGMSYPAALASILGVSEEFDVETEALLARFRGLWRRRVRGDAAAQAELDEVSELLCARGRELQTIVGIELRDLHRRLERDAGAAA